ncbi:LPS assembly protein LptD [Candidatus Profftia tarda]|nr:LPS assembly protein LptD [Candidatus Profftia tarda]
MEINKTIYKKNIPKLVAALFFLLLYNTSVLADLSEQCLNELPIHDKPLVSDNPSHLPIYVQADKININYPDNIVFSGNVRIDQGSLTLTADQVKLEQEFLEDKYNPVRTLTATGSVNYSDNNVQIKGSHSWSNLNNKNTKVWESTYQFLGRQGRGTTDIIQTCPRNRYAILENGTFTSCLPGDNSWSVSGAKIIQDHKEEVAEIWDAQFKIGPVPIFYSPYLRLPVGNKRRSGFLIPSSKYSSTGGLEVSLPWYWSIGSYIDATITPRYIVERGLQVQNELRYLSFVGAGLIEFDWLNNDKQYTNNKLEKNNINTHKEDNKKRWLFYWNHKGVMDHVWHFNVDYTKVSDPHYFNDVYSTHGSSADGYSTQKFFLGYANQNWSASLSTKQFQIFTDAGHSNSYLVEPQVDLNYQTNNLGPFQINLYAQTVKFKNKSINQIEANRYHFEPTVDINWHKSWIDLNTETKFMVTRYEQIIPKNYYINHPRAVHLSSSINRVIPEFKIDSKIILNRNTDWNSSCIQTLEPHVQYLYIPYRDQSNIGIYDSTLLQMDYTGLFRDRIYSGLDRIASANQISTGLTTRIYDDKLIERFNASLGQIYSFKHGPHGGGDSIFTDKDKKTGNLVWASDAYWKISDLWDIRDSLQYDTHFNNIALGDVSIECRNDAKTMIQLNYRYASPEYLIAIIPQYRSNDLYNQGISQVGAVGSFPATKKLALFGGCYYDTKAKQTVNTLVGLQYNTCCWSASMNYERKITSWDCGISEPTSKFDNKLSFNFRLNGFGNKYDIDANKILERGILPYQRFF